MARPIEVSGDEIKTIVKLSLDGHSRKEIATELNRSTNTVWRYQCKYLKGINY